MRGANRVASALFVFALVAAPTPAAADEKEWSRLMTSGEQAVAARRLDFALEEFCKAASIAASSFGSSDVRRANSLANVGLVLSLLNRDREVEAPLAECLEIAEKALAVAGSNQKLGAEFSTLLAKTMVVTCGRSLAMSYFKLWRFADAEPKFRRALELLPQVPGADVGDSLYLRAFLVLTTQSLELPEVAAAEAGVVLGATEAIAPSNAATIAAIMEAYARGLRNRGRAAEADQVLERIKRFRRVN